MGAGPPGVVNNTRLTIRTVPIVDAPTVVIRAMIRRGSTTAGKGHAIHSMPTKATGMMTRPIADTTRQHTAAPATMGSWKVAAVYSERAVAELTTLAFRSSSAPASTTG